MAQATQALILLYSERQFFWETLYKELAIFKLLLEVKGYFHHVIFTLFLQIPKGFKMKGIYFHSAFFIITFILLNL